MARMCRKVRRSLFTKLALVMVLAVIGINFITYSLYVGLEYGHETTLNRSLVHYARAMMQEIGTPPNKEMAQELAQSRMMRITLDGPQSWVVGDTERYFPQRFLQKRFSVDDVDVSNLHGFYRVRVKEGDSSSLTFDLFPTDAERVTLRRYGIISMVGSCLIMLAVYLSLRFFLRPIEWLRDGAADVRDGSLNRRVPERGSGELRELTETFNQMATRLEALVEGQQQLLLGVSHELRTPLTRLKLRLEMLDTDADLLPLSNDIQQMEAMVTTLLDTARTRHDAGHLDKRPENIGELLQDVAAGYMDMTPGVDVIVPEKPVLLDVDYGKLAMVVSTLLDNAIKYSEESSHPVALTLVQSGKRVEIVVSDNGRGIPEEAQRHLFEPFYRVDESRTRVTGGYGLGLYLSSVVVRAHGATLQVESRLGKGTTMRVVFE